VYWAESGSFNNLLSSVFLFVAGSRGVENLAKIFTLPRNVVSVICIQYVMQYYGIHVWILGDPQHFQGLQTASLPLSTCSTMAKL
jgi:hypothetical protein